MSASLRLCGLAEAKEAVTIRLRAATPSDLELLRRWDAAPHIIAS